MQRTIDYIRSVTAVQPRIAVVLGSGLGAFANELDRPVAIPYEAIPDWPKSTAAGHAGKLIFGSIGGVDTAVMAGRAHLYEGYSPAQVVFGVRALGRLGVRSIVFTNAAGGISPGYSQGALALVSARLIATCALHRRESRGSHYRSDYPQTEAVGARTFTNWPEIQNAGQNNTYGELSTCTSPDCLTS